jgi:acylphosphatase
MKAMQVRAVIIASGEVQRVGYRDVVERVARKMKLTGFVENNKPYDVRIVCEGDKKSIDSFFKLIKIKEYPVDVGRLDVNFEAATGEFDYFEIKRGDMTEELGERLDIANAKMTTMIQKQDVMAQKQDISIQKQDVMIDKLDNNTSILKDNTAILKDNTAILKDNTAILKDFKQETNENLTRLTNIMTKHDADAQERITVLTLEISGIKDRLTRLELAVSS